MRCTLLILLISIFSISCEYEPEGSYDAKITEPNNPPNATINLNDFEGQIVLYMNHTFTFTTDIIWSNIYRIDVFLNDSKIHTTENNSSNFFIDPNDYIKGEYILEIKAYSKTNSGSLADHAGAEAYVYSKKWNVLIDMSIMPIQITNIYPESGRLKITWNKYDRSNFQSYQVIKIKEGVNPPATLGYFNDPNTISCYDYNFIGGTSKYFIYINTTDDSRVSDYYTYTDSIPRIISAVTTSDGMVFTWTKCRYPDNFTEYRLYGPDNLLMATPAYNLNDTVASALSSPFGNPFYVILETLPNDESYKEYNWFYTFMGETHQEFTKAIPTKNTQYIFQMYNDHLYRYSIAEDIYVDSLYVANAEENMFAVSLNGNHLIYGTSTQIYKVNPIDFSDYEVYAAADITGHSNDEISMITISDNGIATICGKQSFLIYDFSGKTILFEQAQIKDNVKISQNNQYLIESKDSIKIYKFDGTNIELLNSWPSKMYLLEFDPLNTSKIIRYDKLSWRIELWNCETQLIEKSYRIGSSRSLRIDPLTGFCSMQGSDGYYFYPFTIIDINTVSKIESLSVFSMDNYILHNSVIYKSTGYSLDIESETEIIK